MESSRLISMMRITIDAQTILSSLRRLHAGLSRLPFVSLVQLSALHGLVCEAQKAMMHMGTQLIASDRCPNIQAFTLTTLLFLDAVAAIVEEGSPFETDLFAIHVLVTEIEVKAGFPSQRRVLCDMDPADARHHLNKHSG